MTETKTKRESSTVRSRCLLFIETLHKLGYERIPIDQAKQLFSLTVNVFDRASIKAYFGTYQHVSTHSIQREARYQSGTYSFKTIVLKQKVPLQQGYFDLLGLVSYEWINKTLFLIPKFAVLVPTLKKAGRESIGEFSLSFSQGEEREKPIWEGVSPIEAEESNVLLRTPTNNNNIGCEREIGRVKVIPHTTVELSSEEKMILNAITANLGTRECQFGDCQKPAVGYGVCFGKDTYALCAVHLEEARNNPKIWKLESEQP